MTPLKNLNWHRFGAPIACLLILSIVLSGCSQLVATQITQKIDKISPPIQPTATSTVAATPFLAAEPTLTASPVPSPTVEPFKGLHLWVDPSLSPALAASLHLPTGAKRASDPDSANLTVSAVRGGLDERVQWVYALVAPFPTLTDDVPFNEIERAWRGEPGQSFTGTLLVASSTKAAFEMRWGPSAGERLKVLPEEQLLDTAWANRSDWAIIPFDALEPRWKVLRINGLSLFDKQMDLKAYPLSLSFGVSGDPQALNLLKEQLGATAHLFPETNYDPQKMTVLAMTGVTALARATAAKMDTLGMTYPARDIQDWLRNADLTHISNEVSFNPDCPLGNPMNTSTMFCSRPEYIQLLDFIGADIIELSGNHNNDYSRKASTYSLDLYQKRGWTVYAGGANIEEARKPAKVEVNGTKLAFLGCNPVGPENAWAADTLPGSAECGDYQWLLDEIRQVRAEGYLPVVTFQYFEIYVSFPSEHQALHFREAAEAGAVIVSGSQAHFPQHMEFSENGLIHFGLGNLFFDQMDIPVKGTRREFVDWHIFYNGRYINTQLLTAMLEDYARPRPMTPEEREALLAEIFKSAGW